MSKLQYLDLSMAGVSTDVLEDLFDVCRDLRKVSLENVELNEKICRLVCLLSSVFIPPLLEQL